MDSPTWFIEQLKSVWSVLQTPLVELQGAKLSLTSILFAFVAVVVSVRVAGLAGKALNNALARKHVDSGVRDSLEKFMRYLVISIGVLLAFDIMGFSLNSLAALGAILMVGIGFGLQNITQNFISGVIILIERPVKVGDIIRVGDTSGRVVDIRVRSTVILTRDDVSIIVPNSKIVSEDVINDSFMDRKIRQHVRVGVAYGSDTALVKEILLGVAMSHPEALKRPSPIVVFEGFGDSSLDFDLRFWTTELWEMERICSEMRFEVDRLFREHHVQIPFPQRDLHLKTGWPSPVESPKKTLENPDTAP